jgi:hypothetical protein
MLSGATKEILNMVKRAEQKKSDLEQRLKNLEGKKKYDKQKMHTKEMLVMKTNSGESVSGADALKEIYDDKKTVMDDDHEIAEIKREIAKVDGKISEINHWTAQSEYDDESKQREAVETARSILQSI